jgi:FkbM family methyltransferase
MDFSKISYTSFLGRLLRLPLRLIPRGMVLPILQGALRGRRWIVGAGEHGYWLGSYELGKRRSFERTIFPGAVVVDIGANVGYFSLLAAVLAGKTGRVFAIEPSPRNADYIRRHVRLNKFSTVTVIEAAISDRSGEAFFDLGASIATGHLSESGQIRVDLVTLDSLLAEETLLPPDFIKIDVEGAEFAVLQGAKDVLSQHQPVLFMDTHAREAHQPTVAFLEDLGYTFEILDGKPLPETKEFIAWPGDSPG